MAAVWGALLPDIGIRGREQRERGRERKEMREKKGSESKGMKETESASVRWRKKEKEGKRPGGKG